MPSYRDLFEEIGKHLTYRQSALVWRSLLIALPAIVFIVLYYLADFYVPWLESLPKTHVQFIAFMVIVGLVAMGAAVRFIFEIEKRIWIDSYFDAEPLTLKESWKIASHLFWPVIVFRLKVFIYYYALPNVITLAILFIGVLSQNDVVLLVGFPVSLLAFSLYNYYLRVRLRYTWFYFLDSYGKSDLLTMGRIALEINRLNDVMKGDSFKKSLMVNFGTDIVQGISSVAVGSVQKGLESLGGGMAGVGTVLGVVGKEISRQVVDYGNIAAQYALYRIARKELTGHEQEVNHEVYNLRQ